MYESILTRKSCNWNQVFASAVFIYYLYFLGEYAFPKTWLNLYYVYHAQLVPVLIAFTLYFRRFKEPLEIKLILFFWAWVFITRLLNGDIYLVKSAELVLIPGITYVLLVVCLQLDRKSRDRFIDWIAIVTSLFYTLIAVVCLYAVLFRKELYNPFTGACLCSFVYGYRLCVFDTNPNTVCMWFFLAFFFLTYLFFRTKSLLWRIIIILAALLNYVILGMTFSRNAMIAFSLCTSLLVLVLVLKHLSARGVLKKLLLTAVILCVMVPSIYLSFSATGIAMNKISSGLVRMQADSQYTQVSSAASDSEENDSKANSSSKEDQMYLNNRGLKDTGRLDIFRSIIYTMQQEPQRLLRGCLGEDVMKISNSILPQPKPNYHNTFLQILCLTGIPGLALILAFCVLLSIRIIKIIYGKESMSVTILAIMLVGIFSYNLFEVSLFVLIENLPFTAYIIAGAVLACSYEKEASVI